MAHDVDQAYSYGTYVIFDTYVRLVRVRVRYVRKTYAANNLNYSAP